MKKSKNKFWGWGNQDYKVSEKFLQSVLQLLSTGLNEKLSKEANTPLIDDIRLKNIKLNEMNGLKGIISVRSEDRISHTYGQAFRDVIRALEGDFNSAPDCVAFPKNEKEVIQVLDFAIKSSAYVIPYGGGTSVTGGVEHRSEDRPVICLDLKQMNKIISVNKVNQTATVEAGILGPDLEKGLQPHGLTLRHFPQSFEFSTLGGWIATRSGGHFATRFTQIDEFVQSVRVVSPSGVAETPPFPNSGAGPNINRIFSGSEGILGIITQATMKLQRTPKRKASQTVNFKKFDDGVLACREIAQSGLFPSNARLIGALEALGMQLGDGSCCVLILGFEFHDVDPQPFMFEAISICEKHGGICSEGKTMSSRDENSDQWKKSFLAAPYLRDELILRGLIVETFETCITWERFDDLYRAIMNDLGSYITSLCGSGYITCRFTHLYPDGPAPYFTVMANGLHVDRLEVWDKIEAKASEILYTHQATITHHHAVGRDHQEFFEKENKSNVEALRALKNHYDPKGILNPGVLLRHD